MVAIARRIHLFPFRTQKLSFFTPKVVGGKLPARLGSRHAYSGLAQLVEHLTVNQGVVSSSLTSGVLSNYNYLITFYYGELSERLKEHGWKPCIWVFACIKGSNPLFSFLYNKS